jgi:hypothetical protein
MVRSLGCLITGVSLAFLCFVWGGAFVFAEHSPGFFFYLFWTTITLPFIYLGFLLLSAGSTSNSPKSVLPAPDDTSDENEGPRPIRRRRAAAPPPPKEPVKEPVRGPVNYQCPSCSARIGEGTDVSPLGDCKCEHCGNWFNIHRP